MGASVSACFSPRAYSGLPGVEAMVEPLGEAQKTKPSCKKALLNAVSNAVSASKALHIVQSMVSVLEDASEVVALVNASNSKGQTAIAIASDQGFSDVVQLLLQLGADPWKKNNLGGRTPLHLACLKGRADIVRILLEDLPTQFGNDPCDITTRFVDVRTVSGFTALHFAVRSGHAATIQAVLEHDPSITASSNHDSLEASMNYVAGTTPLHIAAMSGNLEAACALMRHYAMKTVNGATGSTTDTHDPRRKTDSQGRLPWNVAAGVRRSNITQALHPSMPLALFLPEIELLLPDCVPSLQSIAATALKQSLVTSLDRIQGQLVAAATCSSSTQLSALKLPSTRFGCLSEDNTSTPKLSRTAVMDMWEEPTDCRSSFTSFTTSTQVNCMAFLQAASPQACKSSRLMLQTCDMLQKPLLSRQGSRMDGMTSNTLSQFSINSNSQPVSYNAHGALCEICFDSVAFVQPTTCHHAVCRRCATEMVANIKKSPLACPFCRTMVREFTIA